MTLPRQHRFCSCCGGLVEHRTPEHDRVERAVCTACGFIRYVGPELLVMTAVFAEGHILLMRRGLDPYKGLLSVPGGYVEANESPESAAIRETREEVGLPLRAADLVPCGILSVPRINQVHIAFLVRLEKRATLLPTGPEVLAAGWYSRKELDTSQMWPPARDFDFDRIFDNVAQNRLEFYQLTDESLRAIDAGLNIRPVWPPAPRRPR